MVSGTHFHGSDPHLGHRYALDQLEEPPKGLHTGEPMGTGGPRRNGALQNSFGDQEPRIRLQPRPHQVDDVKRRKKNVTKHSR